MQDQKRKNGATAAASGRTTEATATVARPMVSIARPQEPFGLSSFSPFAGWMRVWVTIRSSI